MIPVVIKDSSIKCCSVRFFVFLFFCWLRLLVVWLAHKQQLTTTVKTCAQTKLFDTVTGGWLAGWLIYRYCCCFVCSRFGFQLASQRSGRVVLCDRFRPTNRPGGRVVLLVGGLVRLDRFRPTNQLNRPASSVGRSCSWTDTGQSPPSQPAVLLPPATTPPRMHACMRACVRPWTKLKLLDSSSTYIHVCRCPRRLSWLAEMA